MVTTISVKALDENLIFTNTPVVSCGDVDAVLLDTDLSPEWDGYLMSACFYYTTDEVYEVLLDDAGACKIPWEAMCNHGVMFIGLRGMHEATQAIKTSSVLRYNIVPGTPETTAEPSPGIHDQILAVAVESKNVAETALSKAEQALTKSGEAVTTANSAKSLATNANNTANTAKSTATTASTNATNAVNTANSANTKADSAVSKATEALNKVNNAITGDATTLDGHDSTEFLLKTETGDYLKKTDVTTFTTTLTSSGWTGTVAPYTYTVSNANVKTTSSIFISLQSGVTVTEVEAFSQAMVTGGTQSSGSFVLQAMKEKPTIDIPINVRIEV